MSKGNPNDATRKLNFIPKVWDAKANDGDGAYRPIYIAPEATSTVLGDVYLSDATNSTDDAAKGVTAATPKAVKIVNDNANNKLDKTTSTAQTVKSAVTFSGAVTGSAGMTVPDGQYFTGDLRGNADTASQLSPGRNITVKGTGTGAETVKFTGASDITITLGDVAASKITGVLDISNIPQGALERVVSYASISAAVSAWTGAAAGSKPFDIGDTVRVTGVTPNVMYAVIADPSKTASYVEYAAGTASEALHADSADTATKLATPRTIRTNLASTSAASFDGSANITPGVTGTLPIANGGTGATTANAAEFNIIGTPSNSTSAVSDSTPIACVYATPDASQGSLYKKNASLFWTYIKGKADNTYAAKSHTHSVFSTTANGFVPAADASGDTSKFLRGDGVWAVAGAVTGVKGNAESAYRTGNVNLTPANIGAAAASHTHNYLPLTGGTLTGNLSSRQIAPSATNSYSLGTSSLKWSNVYATTFTGNLTGNVTGSLTGNADTATTANKVNNTITIAGDVTSSAVSLNTTSAITITTALGAGVVGTNELANKAVTNGKLADDVGTVYVGSTQPTEAHVKLWVKV